jgi:hypothetical protein
MDEKGLIAVLILALDQFPSNELAALNMAACLYGNVPEENLAYARALECRLIDPGGTIPVLPELKWALASVITRRTEAGMFI